MQFDNEAQIHAHNSSVIRLFGVSNVSFFIAFCHKYTSRRRYLFAFDVGESFFFISTHREREQKRTFGLKHLANAEDCCLHARWKSCGIFALLHSICAFATPKCVGHKYNLKWLNTWLGASIPARVQCVHTLKSFRKKWENRKKQKEKECDEWKWKMGRYEIMCWCIYVCMNSWRKKHKSNQIRECSHMEKTFRSFLSLHFECVRAKIVNDFTICNS